MKVGDRVEKRGLGHRGTIERISQANWVTVKWDEGAEARNRPRMCSTRELQVIDGRPVAPLGQEMEQGLKER